MEKSNKNTLLIVVAVCLALGFIALIVGFIVRGKGSLADIMSTGTSQTAAVFQSLSTATNFSVLGALSAASANTTVTSGDLGLSPGLAVSRTGPWTVGGTEYFGPASPAFSAQADALSAFNALVAQISDGTWSLNANPLPGVWTAGSSATFSGTLTLNGSYNDVWVFQIGQDLTFTGSVVMAGNAQPCNVFWQVGRDATIASGSSFAGTLIAQRDISLVSGANVNGRIISLTGALTTDGNTISGPTCTPAPSPSTATLHVIKLMVNGNGGTAVPSDFNVHVKSATSSSDVSGSPTLGTSTPGTLYTLSPGSYTVSEDSNALYAQSFNAVDCDSGGNVTLLAGDNKICTIINTDIPPPAPVAPVSSGGGGGGSVNVPLIGLSKVPNPLAVSGKSGSVTYTYTVWNISRQQPLVDVTVKDDMCGPVTLLSGDDNANGKLDLTEYWKYSCTTTLSTTTTNTAVATGYTNDPYRQAAIATAVATVVVGVPGLPNTGLLPPPLITIVKVPSRLTPFPYGGGDVTYTYTVTNPGVVPLHDVTVTDDKCAPVSRISGDTNGDNLLDLTESWIYTCRANVPISTRNVATAKGTANGLVNIGYAFATVLVSAPSFPNTGFPPKGI